MAAFFLLSAFAWCREGEKPMDIKIKLSKPTFFLGESVSAEFIYTNNKSEAIVIDNPSKSYDVSMHVVDISNKEDLSYTTGKPVVTDIDRASGQYVLTNPPKEQIKIAARSSFKFISDLNEKLYLRPGGYDCYLTDHAIESNHLKISIKLTASSVEHLLEVVQNKEAGYSRREWAMEFLQKLRPSFKLTLPLENDPADVKTQKESNNTASCHEFSAWWHSNMNSQHVKGLLK